MPSTSIIHLCPSCQTGYIMSFDQHDVCEGPLGPRHVDLASTCRPCELLPPEEKQRRAALFKANVEECVSVAEHYLLDDAIAFFNELHSESDDSSGKGDAGNSPAAPSLFESVVTEEGGPSGFSATLSLPTSATTSLPAVGALLLEPPSIIQEAADTKGLSVPLLPPPRSDDLVGRFGSTPARHPDPIWPRFPAVTSYWNEAAAGPGKLKAPVSTFTSITRVEGFTERSFPSVPPLEPSLVEAFGA